MMAAVGALGLPPDALEVLIVQMVRLLEGGELAKMSKRPGQIVPMEDLLAEVGRDAARFFFLMRSADSHLDFDLDLAKHRSSDNPVYYVQYAHARICSILRQADAGSEPDDGLDLSLLTQEPELALIRLLADFPEEVAGAAFAREPHRLTRYASELAAAFHKFYDTCRVLTDEAPLRRARLALVDAARIVLSNVLGLCGVSAPRKM
jgi:arginyl-tRNA synthetase